MDINDIQRHLDQVMYEQNHRSVPEFESYSPYEMHHILHDTFGINSPIQFQSLSESDYQLIPMLNQIKYLLELIDKAGELKLTEKGFLPVKVVAELFQQGFIKDYWVEKGFKKVYKETDVMNINLTRLLVEISGLVKKRNGKLSLTNSSKKILKNNAELLKLIFLTHARKFNWAFYDGFGENHIGQLGYGYSLILLSKYGHEPRPNTFYAEKYFKAYPTLLDSIEPNYDTVERFGTRCYSVRTFERFLEYYGLINREEKKKLIEESFILTKSDLFDKLFLCRPQKKQ